MLHLDTVTRSHYSLILVVMVIRSPHTRALEVCVVQQQIASKRKSTRHPALYMLIRTHEAQRSYAKPAAFALKTQCCNFNYTNIILVQLEPLQCGWYTIITKLNFAYIIAIVHSIAQLGSYKRHAWILQKNYSLYCTLF